MPSKPDGWEDGWARRELKRCDRVRREEEAKQGRIIDKEEEGRVLCRKAV